MYTGYLLTEQSKQQLEKLYPPSYPDYLGHHITERFGVKHDHPAPEQPQSVRVVGYVNNDKNVEGFLVEVNGTTSRQSGGTYHITWSIDRSTGAKPVDTNSFLKFAEKISPIQIEVESKTFTQSTQSYVKKGN